MDSKDLISKKELLDLMDISYGQFYRWKRMGLIPEEWFIRKSTFTGQETFLPREKVISRIQRILQLKQGQSLEDIAAVVSPELAASEIDLAQVAETTWISAEARIFYDAIRPHTGPYTLSDLLCMQVAGQLLSDTRLTRDQTALAIRTLANGLDQLPSGSDRLLVIASRLGMTFVLLVAGSFVLDAESQLLYQINLNEALEFVKERMTSS